MIDRNSTHQLLLFLRVGAGDFKHHVSLGQANKKLMWQQGGPYLNYTNGDLCQNGMRHYTIIGFFCGPEGSANAPLLMEEYPCQTIIHWNTDLVCEKRVSIFQCESSSFLLTLLCVPLPLCRLRIILFSLFFFHFSSTDEMYHR